MQHLLGTLLSRDGCQSIEDGWVVYSSDFLHRLVLLKNFCGLYWVLKVVEDIMVRGTNKGCCACHGGRLRYTPRN